MEEKQKQEEKKMAKKEKNTANADIDKTDNKKNKNARKISDKENIGQRESETVENSQKPSSGEGDLKEKESKAEDKKSEEKKESKSKVKKTEAVVNSKNLPISTKESMAVCRFIKGKKIDDAINDLGKVVLLKTPVRMKGEIPHRRGKGMMSGRFPKKTAEHFIKLLKSLSGNANSNEIGNPVVVEAIANSGQKVYGKFGRVQRKRTHVRIVAKSQLKKRGTEK